MDVGVIHALLKVSRIGATDSTSHRLLVTLVVSIYVLEHLHQLSPLVHIAICVGSFELEYLLLSSPEQLHSVLILLCRIVKVYEH